MTSAIVCLSAEPGAPALVDDLESVGIHVIGAIDLQDLVRETVRRSPDVVICWDRHPEEPLFAALAVIASTAPLPLVVFTDDHAAEKIERSATTGIHAYVVSGYGPTRLRPTIQLARARFRHEQALRAALRDVQKRFEERKLVDRAKGILMRAQQISEEDAFRILRTTSMHSKQRVGKVSQHVIEAARDAESVNRAGLLRMLSQQLVKRYALAALASSAAAPGAIRDSVDRIERSLSGLEQGLSKETYGDLLDAVRAAWAPLLAAVVPPVRAERVAAIDALAEQLLVRADQLTTYLQTVGSTGSLRVINISGRQRMLVQRLAKQALLSDGLGMPGPSRGDDPATTRRAFEEGLAYLNTIPLVSREISALLDASRIAWQELTAALVDAKQHRSQFVVAEVSETLVSLFDRLTDQYERSMEMLIG